MTPIPLQVTEHADSQCSTPDAPNEMVMKPIPPLTANNPKGMPHGRKVWLPMRVYSFFLVSSPPYPFLSSKGCEKP